MMHYLKRKFIPILLLAIFSFIVLNVWQESKDAKVNLQSYQNQAEESQKDLSLAKQDVTDANRKVDLLVAYLKKVIPAEWTTFSETQFDTKFSVDYPKDWSLDVETSSDGKTKEYFFKPVLSFLERGEPGRVNILLTVDFASGNAKLSQREGLAEEGVFRYINLEGDLRALQMFTNSGVESYPLILSIVVDEKRAGGPIFYLSSLPLREVRGIYNEKILSEFFDEMVVYNRILRSLRLL